MLGSYLRQRPLGPHFTFSFYKKLQIRVYKIPYFFPFLIKSGFIFPITDMTYPRPVIKTIINQRTEKKTQEVF